MKKTFRTILAGALALLTVSCYDDSALRTDIADLKERVTELENKLNSEVSTLNTTIGALQTEIASLKTADANFMTELGQITAQLDAIDGKIDGKVSASESAVLTKIEDLKKDYAALEKVSAETIAKLTAVGVTKVEKNAAGNAVITFVDGNTVEVPAKPSTGIVTIVDGKWAVVGADGKTTVLDAQLHPDTKIEFQVDPKTGELKYSLGGQFVSTGAYVAGEAFSVVTNVVEGDGIVTITIGGVEYDLPLVSTNTFEIVSGKVFFNGEETKAIAIKLDGMVSSMVANKPKGWEVSLTKGGGLNVTAPALEEVITEEEDWWSGEILTDTTYVAVNGGDMGGSVEIWVVLEDGKTVVGNLAVAIATAPADIRFDSEGNVTYKFPVSDTGYGYEAPEFILYGAVKAENFDRDAVFANIQSFAMTYNHPEVYHNNYGQAEVMTHAVADLVGEEPQVGSSYVFWAIHNPTMIGRNPDGTYIFDVTPADFQLEYLTPTEVNVSWTASAFSLTADIEVKGAESFYAFACDKFMWAQVQEALENKWVAFDQLFSGLDAVRLVRVDESSYKVDFSTWGVPEEHLSEGYRNEINPENQYVLGVIPAVASKVVADYTLADLQIFEQATSSMKAGGKAQIAFDESEVGYNKITYKVNVTGAYRAWYKYLSASEKISLGIKETSDLEDYILENYLDFNYMPIDYMPYPLSAQQLAAGEEVTVLVLALDEEGGYTIGTKSESTKAVTYAEEGIITVKAVSIDKTNAKSPVVTFEVTGADKLIIGEKPRSTASPTDELLSTTAINILGTYPTSWGQYTYVNVVNGKASVTLSYYTSYSNWAVTAIKGTTAADAQLMKPYWMSIAEVNALPETVTE